MTDDSGEWESNEDGAIESTANVFKNILKGFGDLGEPQGEGA